MCDICNEQKDNFSELLSNEEIDKMNMDKIDDYLEQQKEYEKKGYWTGFMGVKIESTPPEPKFIEYN